MQEHIERTAVRDRRATRFLWRDDGAFERFAAKRRHNLKHAFNPHGILNRGRADAEI